MVSRSRDRSKLTSAERVAQHMALYAQHPEMQVAQTQFRQAIADVWEIPVGAHVLEIGCGQGDMTAVLADRVGDTGYVTAVDVETLDYGRPVCLRDSWGYLLASPLGKRITFHSDFDVLEEEARFHPDSFDFVVLSHCSWYFASLNQLFSTLQRARQWANRLCYSEWDLDLKTEKQLGHLLEVLIQGQVQAFKQKSSANVRTPFSEAALRILLKDAGWQCVRKQRIDVEDLDEVREDINDCIRASSLEAAALEIPAKLVAFLRSQTDMLKSARRRSWVRPLSSYVLLASRIDHL